VPFGDDFDLIDDLDADGFEVGRASTGLFWLLSAVAELSRDLQVFSCSAVNS